MNRYLVTGRAGCVGSHLTDPLLAAGHEVTGIDSFSGYCDLDVSLPEDGRLVAQTSSRR